MANAVVLLLFVSCLFPTYNYNIATTFKKEKLVEPTLVTAIIGSMQLVHDWHLFAPHPYADDGWWVIDGVTESGKALDPLTGKAPQWEKPDNLSTRHSHHWRKYLYRIWTRDYSQYRLYFGKYLTLKNHRETPVGERLVSFKI